MTADQLRQLLEGLPGHLPVRICVPVIGIFPDGSITESEHQVLPIQSAHPGHDQHGHCLVLHAQQP